MAWLAFLSVPAILLTLNSAQATFNGSNNALGCRVEPIKDLGQECRPLVVYNQLEWQARATEEALELARHCACQLVNLDWGTAFSLAAPTRRVSAMVRGVLGMHKYQEEGHYPAQLWSDTEVIAGGISIHLATKDFFLKRRRDDSYSWIKKEEFDRSPALLAMRRVCVVVAKDRSNYYQYLENLQRLNSVMFFQVLAMNYDIDLIYQASKVCKLFMLHRLNEFKLRPTSGDFYAPDDATLKPIDLATLNDIAASKGAGLNELLDETLRDASVELTNCRAHQQQGRLETLGELELECPMMVSDVTPNTWFNQHQEPLDRSQAALRCGCQLLLHNASWAQMVRDPNVQVMSDTLTNYMHLHPLPSGNLAASGSTGAGTGKSPLLSTHEYFSWFQSVMAKFAKNKRVAVKEVVKFKRTSEDPTNEINGKTNDEEEALELLRLGCNRVMFNHVKGSPKQTDDIKLIKYLDNLQFITQDPLFVFHLTLQDENLFKLYALSKMCVPVVR